MPNLGLESAVGLTKVRAQILEFLRANQGTYQQESDEAAKRRAAIGATLCNAFRRRRRATRPHGHQTEHRPGTHAQYADAGQNADDKLLRGWLDVDEFYGGGAAPPVTCANDKVFVGNDPANNGAAKLGAVAR